MSLVKNWASMIKDEIYLPSRAAKEKRDLESSDTAGAEPVDTTSAEEEKKKGLNKYMTVVAAGAGLFSDGYVNNSIGTVNTILQQLYPKDYANSPAQSNVASIAFAGTVFGQLFFGFIADHYGRKIGMLICTYSLIILSILCGAAYGAGGSVGGMLAAITVYRFFIGVSIGGEYASGSTATAEAANLMSKGHRNRWFVLFTNFMIDSGFVVAAIVPCILLSICGEDNLNPVWRVTLIGGALAPLSLLYFRSRFENPKQFKNNNFRRMKTPYWLLFKYYWPRLIVVSLIWFIYDFSAYAFGIYSSTIINQIVPDGSLYQTFGWNVVLNLFYIPGSFCGAFAADYIGPRLCVVVGMGLQGVIGFIMASQYEHLKNHTAGFVVIYGIFMTLGEFGAGDQIGCLVSRSSASSCRGVYYGIAAGFGKIGAFVGTYIFPIIIRNAGGADSTSGNQAPFWVSSSLCFLACALALFGLPNVGQDAVSREDEMLRNYLAKHGIDTTLMCDIDVLEDASVTSTEESPVEEKKVNHQEPVIEEQQQPSTTSVQEKEDTK